MDLNDSPPIRKLCRDLIRHYQRTSGKDLTQIALELLGLIRSEMDEATFMETMDPLRRKMGYSEQQIRDFYKRADYKDSDKIRSLLEQMANERKSKGR